jgi:ATP-dependent Zn protease
LSGEDGTPDGMEEDDQIDEVLAYHEAGHAVVAWSLGFKILEISLGPRGEDRGFCKDSLTNKVH